MHRKQEINFQPISYARGAKQHNQNRVSEDALVSSNSIGTFCTCTFNRPVDS